MIFKRALYKDLLEWKSDNAKRDFGSKMVLKLDGARQVGKTTLSILFGKENYETCTYINLLDSAQHRQDIQYKALEEKKIDYAISAKGDTFGGVLIAEKKHTIPIYLFSKFKFDLGEKVNSLLPDIDI
ncbi:AAA family ATPase [Clostridium beijerinckii]|uniref:AAA family ATPase n=1 Tax=Clostridium beijerinckii TaxID=1520 RepID=UPI0012B16E4B|nr:AAA family ATPase [Clostridium beijerinckii]MRY42665.1 AAA family ATPase [Parabacteroides distasonis]MZK52047.1 AAA family ATPase [Clostridium beijerinckii]MZK60188.1 AAA family ATPase [Clostridium beijerinckii]MZK70473.1 AAA family ATPase [Clostridium beijerinckii]MZK75775.1 AAA family ATPase [Clostridium beijerinckii]